MADFNAIVTRVRSDERAIAAGDTPAGSDDTSGSPRSAEFPLAGVPIAVKDVIDVAEVVPSMGSNVPVQPEPAEASATIVARLQDAGAQVVATTNCQEFSYGILGDESAHGRSVNPIDPALVTGGSSMGSAIMVAAGEVLVAIGTDTAGSVRAPAACTGVIGFKPTLGTLPTDGIFPLSPSFDTPGFFARDTDTIATAFAVTQGDAARASATNDSAHPVIAGLTADLSLLEAATADSDLALRSATTVTVNALEAAGVQVTDANTEVLTRLLDDAAPIYSVVRRYEAYRIHEPYLADYQHLYQPGVLKKILAGRDIEPGEYEAHLRMLADLRERALQETSGSDLIVTPALVGDVPRWDAITPRTADDFVRYSMPFNVLGWPAIVVPTPAIAPSGVPVAVHIAAKPEQDATVLEAAHQLQRPATMSTGAVG